MKRIVFLLIGLTVNWLAFADSPPSRLYAWNLGQFVPSAQYDGGPLASGWGQDWDASGGIDPEGNYAFNRSKKTLELDSATSFDASILRNAGPGTFAISSAGSISGLPISNLSWSGSYFSWGFGTSKISAGSLSDNDYSFLSYIDGNALVQRLSDSQSGANLKVFPLPRLSLQITGFYPVPSGVSTSSGVNVIDNFSVGAKVTVPSAVTIFGYYKTIQSDYNVSSKYVTGTNAMTGKTVVIDASRTKRYFDFGAQFTGIKGFGIQGELSYDVSTTMSGTSTSGLLNPSGPTNLGTLSAALNQVGIYLGVTTVLVANWDLSLDFFLYSEGSRTVETMEGQAQYHIANTPYSIGVILGYDGGAGQMNGGIDKAPAFNDAASRNTLGEGALIYPYIRQVFDDGSGEFRVGFEASSGEISPTDLTSGETNVIWGLRAMYSWSG